MDNYPTDIDLNEGKDVHLDAGNDIALTSGVDQLQQSIAIDADDELQAFVSGRLNGENIGRLEEAIRQGLDEDPQLSSVQDVTLNTFDRKNSIVKMDVTVVENKNFTLGVDV